MTFLCRFHLPQRDKWQPYQAQDIVGEAVAPDRPEELFRPRLTAAGRFPAKHISSRNETRL